MIYLDHSATTPVDKKVLQAMLPYFNKKFGNASSIHKFGQEAVAGVDKARGQVANFLNCNLEEIIFTSGATEANNLAIKGLINALKIYSTNQPHIITSSIEHDAVLEPCAELEKQGVQVTYLPVNANGIVNLEKLKSAIQENTVLVSIMYVNSEVGSIQPIREIGKIIKKTNQQKLKNWQKLSISKRKNKPQPIYFHTDATQAINFFNCDVKWNYLDMLSLSGHKIYGPKGIGALYKQKNVPIMALQTGGHHEINLRSGTLNVPGIVGLGAAVNQLNKKFVQQNNKKISELRDFLILKIKQNIPNIILNTDTKNATPAHAHFSFLGVEGESILIALDLEGIAVSTGSACASTSLKASHVLLAMGIQQEIAHNSIRFTLGKNNTKIEIQKLVKILPPIIKRLRQMNPVKLKVKN